MPDKEINIHARVHEAEEGGRKLDAMSQSAEKLGNATQEAGRSAAKGGEKISQAGNQAEKASGATNMLRTAMKSLTGYLAGLATATTLWGFFKKWLDWVEKIAEAQKKLVESTKELDTVTKALASQANVMGSEEGMEGARKQVLAIQEAGNTSFGLAGSVAVATHSAFGTSGELLGSGEQEIAGVVAGAAQRKDLSEGEAGQLLKLLSAMGVTDAAGAETAIQKLFTVQLASQAQSFGEFIGGATDSVITQKAQGATDEFALASYAMGLDIDGGPQAATKIEQMSAHLQNEKIIEAISKESGMSGTAFREMPYDQRVGMFSEWIEKHGATGAGQQYLIKSGLSGDQLGAAVGLYTTDLLNRRGMFQGLAGNATGEQFRAEAEGYAGTTQGRVEAVNAANERLAASATPDQRMGMAIIEASEEQWNLMSIRGETRPYFTDFGEEADRVRKLIRKPLLRRMYSLPDGPEKNQIRGILDAEPVLRQNRFTAGEIGEVDRLLQQAEDKYQGQLKDVDLGAVDELELNRMVERQADPSSRIPDPRPITINNNYHYDNSMNYKGAIEDQERGPRYSPY